MNYETKSNLLSYSRMDRDKKPLNPDDVIEAINKIRKDFGDPALPASQNGVDTDGAGRK